MNDYFRIGFIKTASNKEDPKVFLRARPLRSFWLEPFAAHTFLEVQTGGNKKPYVIEGLKQENSPNIAIKVKKEDPPSDAFPEKIELHPTGISKIKWVDKLLSSSRELKQSLNNKKRYSLLGGESDSINCNEFTSKVIDNTGNLKTKDLDKKINNMVGWRLTSGLSFEKGS